MLKSKFVPTAPWHTTYKNGELLIFCTSYTSVSDAPAMNSVTVINVKIELNVYIKLVKLSKIKVYSLPAFINSTSTVNSIVDAVQKVSSCSASSTAKTLVDNRFYLVLMLVLTLLEPFVDKAEKFGNVIWFICEQLKLILKNKLHTPHSLQCFLHYFAVLHRMVISVCISCSTI